MMGWASAGDIFDPVAEALVRCHIDYDDAVRILSTLIEKLQEGDWDTEHESLGNFRQWPEVVEAFRQNGIFDYCNAEREFEDPVLGHVHTECELEKGHVTLLHKDWKGRTWE